MYGVQFDLAKINGVSDDVQAVHDVALDSCPNGNSYDFSDRYQYETQKDIAAQLDGTPAPDDTFGEVGDSEKWLISVATSFFMSWCVNGPIVMFLLILWDMFMHRNSGAGSGDAPNGYNYVANAVRRGYDKIVFPQKALLTRPYFILQTLRLWDVYEDWEKRLEAGEIDFEVAVADPEDHTAQDFMQITTALDSVEPGFCGSIFDCIDWEVLLED